MGVLGTEAVLADADVSSVQVDVFPVETERLPLAETECQGDDPPRAVTELGGLDEEALNLLDRERLDVLFFESRSLGDLGHVGGDVTASLGLTEGDPDRPVSVVGGAGGAPGLLHLPVEALQVLGLQFVELVGTQAGDEVNAYIDLVAVVRVLGDVRLGDVLDPVLKPGLQRPALARLPELLVVPRPLHFAYSLGDFGLGLALDVAAVRSSAVAQAGGGVLPPPGPSMRMTAWKWTAPRFWYSATLAKETRAWSRRRRCEMPARLATSRRR